MTLRGRVSGASAMDGSRSGNLGRQLKGGGAPSAQKLQQERETVAKQIAATEEYIARLEAQAAATSAEAAETSAEAAETEQKP